MKVRVVGLYAEPQKKHVPKGRPVRKLLAAELPKLTSLTPILLQAGTGAGKTTAVLDSVVPFAVEHRLTVWFVSSRAAINTQFKLQLAKKLGIETVTTDYTPDGLRHLEDIGPVRILTYHRLWAILNTAPEEANGVGILVFDEVHALALDATFVSFTGKLIRAIPQAFGQAIRIYLSATPEPILPALSRAEGHQAITIYKWPADYQQFRLYFWSKPQDLADHFNELPGNERALIFVRSIAEGLALQKKLSLSSFLITAGTKETEPDQWAELLEQGHIEGYQILLATAALDAGVSLCDPALKHIACYGINPATVVQQAGRKRLRAGEKVSLYLFDPNQKQLGHLCQKDENALTALHLNGNDPHRFLREYILEDDFPQARRMCTVTPKATLEVNSLAVEYYIQELERIQKLLRSEDEYPLETRWPRLFRQASVKGRLDSGNKKVAEQALREFLQHYVGQSLKGEEQDAFAQAFRQHYTAAFGRQKNDRADRSWGLSTCRKKLAALNWAITIDSVGQAWVLRNEGGELHG